MAKDFTEWVSARQRDKATILKQGRLLPGENATERKRLGDRPGNPGGRRDGDGTKKKGTGDKKGDGGPAAAAGNG